MPTPRAIVPIVAIPPDRPGWTAAWLTALDCALDEALTWWQHVLGAPAFTARPALAIGLRQNAATYTGTPTTQDLIQHELAAYWPALAETPDQGPLYVVYAALGAAPYQCPGNVIGTSFSASNDAVLVLQSSTSLDAFLGLAEDDPEPSNHRAAQVGALAHELGHALTLPHPSEPADQAQTIMWSWWSFPRIGVLDRESSQARDAIAGWPAIPAAAA